MIRLVVAEDDLLVREGLRSLLDAMDEFEVVATAADVAELEEVLDQAAVDVVITDIRMPPSHTDEGIRAARAIRQRQGAVGVVVLSQYDEPEYVLSLLDEGSDGLGYLLKERVSDPAYLRRAIESVHRGDSAIDPKIIDVLIAARTRSGNAVDHLTGRETEVLSLIAEGMNNSTIAETLVISEKAVHKHINNIFSKLDLTGESEVHRRVKAVLLWLARDH